MELFFGAANVAQVKASFPLAKAENIIVYKSRIGLFRFVKDIPEIISKYKIDFAHFQYIVPEGKKNCKYIVTTHDILFNDFKSDFSFTYRFVRNILFKRGLRRSDIKTTVSEYSKQRISHYFNMPLADIHVIPNGVNPGFAASFDTSEAAAKLIEAKYQISNYILYVSRIEPRKNHLALLQAYIESKLYARGMSLVFIGKKSIGIPEFDAYLSALPAEQKKNIYHLGQVDQEDLEAFYKGCRLFAYVSKAEGFGIPPLEAAVARVPVLCSDKTAMSDFKFFSPFLFNPYDLRDLQLKLEQLLDDPILPGKLETVAKEVLERYSWRNSAKQLYALINQEPAHTD